MIVSPSDRCITYSSALTLVPTYECFNRCTYCNFRVDPGHDSWMTVEHARTILTQWGDRPQSFLNLSSTQTGNHAQITGHLSPPIIEILILSGEVHPHSPRRDAWFQRIYDLCELALNLGFLPHTNVGPLSYAEMARLKHVNVSMGLMLEQLTPALLSTVHRRAPSKVPDVRLQQLSWAGELQIPFTTGLLLGIGETEADWQDTLRAIAQLHQTYHHIQEVILQPHSPGTQQHDRGTVFPLERLVEVVAIARQILPAEVVLQIPPNLVTQPELLLACLDAGARDLGGISPKDEVNPDYPHPHQDALIALLEPTKWHLQPRLPVYPQFDSWLPEALQRQVTGWRKALFSGSL